MSASRLVTAQRLRPVVVSVQDAALLVGCSEALIRKCMGIKDCSPYKHIPARRRPDGNLYIKYDDLEAWVNAWPEA